MNKRLNPYQASPDTMAAMIKLEEHLRRSGLEYSLIELVKTRASQINGCTYCIHMHTRDARAAGESETRLYLLSAWRESPLFTPRERAALAWTEVLTLLAQAHPSDEDYHAMREHFSDDEAVKLTLLIGAINVWNRVAIGFGAVHPVDRADGGDEALEA